MAGGITACITASFHLGGPPGQPPAQRLGIWRQRLTTTTLAHRCTAAGCIGICTLHNLPALRRHAHTAASLAHLGEEAHLHKPRGHQKSLAQAGKAHGLTAPGPHGRCVEALVQPPQKLGWGLLQGVRHLHSTRLLCTSR